MFTFIISKWIIIETFLIAENICEIAPPSIRLIKKFRISAVFEEFLTVVVTEASWSA
jgi:hypothetical protein